MGEPTTFIKLDRGFLDHWLNTQKPFDEAHAWIYLLLKANYKEGKHKYRGTIQTVRRGELMTSETKLAEDWGWGRRRVHTFLNLLEKDGMVTVKRTADGTGVFVENYAKYQDGRTASDTAGDTATAPAPHRDRTASDTHNKNIKKDKERKEGKEYISAPSGTSRRERPSQQTDISELMRQTGDHTHDTVRSD